MPPDREEESLLTLPRLALRVLTGWQDAKGILRDAWHVIQPDHPTYDSYYNASRRAHRYGVPMPYADPNHGTADLGEQDHRPTNRHVWMGEAASGGHWVTIKSADGMSTHIMISGGGAHPSGTVLAGPKRLIGANIKNLPAAPDFSHTHHAAGTTPKGAHDHPDFADKSAAKAGTLPAQSRVQTGESFHKAQAAAQVKAGQYRQGGALDAATTKQTKRFMSGHLSAPGGTLSDADATDQMAQVVGARYKLAGMSQTQASTLFRTLGLHDDGINAAGHDAFQKLAAGLDNDWDVSSSDGLKGSVAMQITAQKLYGADRRDFTKNLTNMPGKDWQGVVRATTDPSTSKALEIAVREHYAETQDALKRAGVTHLTLYRGVQQMPIPALEDAVGKNTGAVAVTLPPGAMTQNPLTSWSSDYRTALEYAGDPETGAQGPGKLNSVIATTVPAAHVFSLPKTGAGKAGLKEVVVIGYERPMIATDAPDSRGWGGLLKQMDSRGYTPPKAAPASAPASKPAKKPPRESAPVQAEPCLDEPQDNADWIKRVREKRAAPKGTEATGGGRKRLDHPDAQGASGDDQRRAVPRPR